MSQLEQQLLFEILALGLPHPRLEYRFAREVVGEKPGLRDRLQAAGLKDWRFDFAWPDKKLAVEVEGGSWTGGRHTRGKGFSDDCQKYAEAVLLGWKVLRFTSDQIDSGYAGGAIERFFKNKGAKL